MPFATVGATRTNAATHTDAPKRIVAKRLCNGRETISPVRAVETHPAVMPTASPK